MSRQLLRSGSDRSEEFRTVFKPVKNFKDFRLRYSLRTLLLLPLLFPTYVLLENLTRTHGLDAVSMAIGTREKLSGTPKCVAPFLLERWDFQQNDARKTVDCTLHYYLWLPGTVIELPFTRVPEDGHSRVMERADELTIGADAFNQASP